MSQFEGKPFPARISVTTYNVWGNTLWPERANSLKSVLHVLKSEVYLLQEVTPEIIAYLDTNLTNYKRVEPIPSTLNDINAGWINQCNIYWNDDLLTMVDFGKSEIGVEDQPTKAMFWGRLSLKAQPEITFFVSTVSFPSPDCPAELRTGINQRIPATINLCECLRKLLEPNEAVILAGDFNDDFHPIRILQEEMGMLEVFESLDLPAPSTYPVRPSYPMEEMHSNRTRDWIMTSLPPQCRVISAFAKERRGGEGPPPSSHKPITAIFEIK